MGIFFVYILKSAVCLAVFYLFYRLLLSRETFHRFNRIAILGILVLSLILPLCEVTVEDQTDVQQTMLSWEQLLLMVNDTEVAPQATGNAVSLVQMILIAYFAGILFFVCRNLYSFMRMILLLKSSKREKLEDNTVLVIHSRDDLSPFSWLKYVVISEKDFHENGREILIHELAHIRNRHSFDLFIADVCIFFQWFNPAAWLLKQELQNIHEYEADETVLKEGVDAKQYQLLIIKKAVGTRLYSMANSFNHGKLKKRITMMLKEKSSPWARLKYLYVLPLAAVAVTAFARPEVSNELKEISAVKVNDLTAIVEAKTSEKASAGADSEAFKGMLDDGLNTPEAIPDDVIMIIDGTEVNQDLFSTIDPERINDVTVLKDEDAVTAYGEKAKNGVMLVTLKEPEHGVAVTRLENPQKAQDKIKVKGLVQGPDGKPVIGATVLIKGTQSGTITNAEGRFTIEAPKGSTLIVSYIGMKKAEVKVKEEMTIKLEAD